MGKQSNRALSTKGGTKGRGWKGEGDILDFLFSCFLDNLFFHEVLLEGGYPYSVAFRYWVRALCNCHLNSKLPLPLQLHKRRDRLWDCSTNAHRASIGLEGTLSTCSYFSSNYTSSIAYSRSCGAIIRLDGTEVTHNGRPKSDINNDLRRWWLRYVGTMPMQQRRWLNSYPPRQILYNATAGTKSMDARVSN